MSSGTTILKLARDSRVRCVALSNDGDILVVGGFDKKVLLLDVHSGARLTSCPGADDTVRSVHLSADSRLLALGCEKRGKGCALLYALVREGCLEPRRFVCLILVPEIMARALTAVHLCAQPEGELRHLWQHDKVVWCVRLSPDSQLLVACGYDMQMTVYATSTYEKLHSVKYPSECHRMPPMPAPQGPPRAIAPPRTTARQGPPLLVDCFPVALLFNRGWLAY